MYKLFLIAFAVCNIQKVQSLTELEMKLNLMKLALTCIKTHPVEMSELMILQQYIVPKKHEVKCLLACVYKLDGLMTEDGSYNIEHAYRMAEEMKNGDETRYENGKKMADLCSKEVDAAKKKDDEEGCEAAFHLFKCTVENAPKFGFKL